MTVPVRLAAFALVLAVGFGAAFAVGAAVGPIDDGTPSAVERPGHRPDDGSEHGG